MASKIVEITQKNWYKYRQFLVEAMKTEFPRDEQLTEEEIFKRATKPEGHQGKAHHFVRVIGEDIPTGFIIFHRYATSCSPTSLIEYAAVVKERKSKGYGTELVVSTKKTLKQEGVIDTVMEGEPVPRVVNCDVHKDLKDCYLKTGNLVIFRRGNLKKQFGGIDRRNEFWQKLGFKIIDDLPYCQPNLNAELQEAYTGQYRVPLDLHIAGLVAEDIVQVSAGRVRDILTALAGLNYGLGDKTEEFVNLQLGNSHSGVSLKDITYLSIISYTELLCKPSVIKAFKELEPQLEAAMDFAEDGRGSLMRRFLSKYEETARKSDSYNPAKAEMVKHIYITTGLPNARDHALEIAEECARTGKSRHAGFLPIKEDWEYPATLEGNLRRAKELSKEIGDNVYYSKEKAIMDIYTTKGITAAIEEHFRLAEVNAKIGMGSNVTSYHLKQINRLNSESIKQLHEKMGYFIRMTKIRAMCLLHPYKNIFLSK